MSLKVIEKKLLAALDESDKVAILASKQNLDDLIWAMHRSLAQADWDKVRMERMYELLAGMRQLSSEAFPLNRVVSRHLSVLSDIDWSRGKVSFASFS